MKTWFKKIQICILLASTTCLQPLFSQNDDMDFDDFDIEAFEDFDFENLDIVRSNTHNGTWTSLVQGILQSNNMQEPVLKLVEHDFYTRTNQPGWRNPLDYTSGLPQVLYSDESSVLNLYMLANISPTKYFTEEGNTLEEYTDIENESLTDIIGVVAGGASQFDIGESLSLFQKAKLQERTLGIIPEWNHFGDRFVVRIKTPLLYTQRNAYFTKEEKEEIYNSPLVKYAATTLGMTGDLSEEDEWTLARKYFIADQIGIGDTRISFLYRTLTLPETTLHVGGWLQLPTNIAFARGLLGSWFEVNNDRTSLDLGDIDPLSGSLTSANITQLTDFFINSLLKLNSNILNPKLGLKDSIGLALHGELDWQISPRVQSKSTFTAQYFTPIRQPRFFIKESSGQFRNIALEIKDVATSTQEQQAKYVDALQSEIQDRFYPYVYDADVFPGFMLHNLTNVFIKINDSWNVGVGYDTWWQSAESISKVHGPKDIVAHLNTKIAENLSAYQIKPTLQCNYHTPHKKHLWNVCLFADATVMQQSIGYDFTLGLKLSVDW